MSTLKSISLPRYRRLLWLDEQVREGRYPNLADYCALFEIDVCTAYRDVGALRYDLDAPLEYDRRRRGYPCTDPRFSLRAVTLTEGELVALFLGKKVLRQYGSHVEALGPEELGERAAEEFRKLAKTDAM